MQVAPQLVTGEVPLVVVRQCMATGFPMQYISKFFLGSYSCTGKPTGAGGEEKLT